MNPVYTNSIIYTHNLTKSFGNVQALKGVNLQVPAHSIFGFLGPNGAGKTTLMKTLLGLIKPGGGMATVFGLDIVQSSVAIRERVGYLPQQPRFIDYLTAREMLRFNARFYFQGPAAGIERRVDEMLALVGLEDLADRPVRGFSGGEKQRLGIALAQVHAPDLLILDEPAAALDPIGRQQVLEIMDRLRAHTTIFYSTHILDDVQRVSDTVAILKAGRIVAQGPIDSLLHGRDGIPVYSVSLKGLNRSLLERLAELPWVAQVNQVGLNGSTTLQIVVSEEQVAEQNLLRIILAEPDVVVTDFNRKKYELEEVFMEIVSADEPAG